MKELFKENETENFTKEAVLISEKVNKVLKPLFDELVKEGYSVRGLEYIIKTEVTDMAINKLIGLDLLIQDKGD